MAALDTALGGIWRDIWKGHRAARRRRLHVPAAIVARAPWRDGNPPYASATLSEPSASFTASSMSAMRSASRLIQDHRLAFDAIPQPRLQRRPGPQINGSTQELFQLSRHVHELKQLHLGIRLEFHHEIDVAIWPGVSARRRAEDGKPPSTCVAQPIALSPHEVAPADRRVPFVKLQTRYAPHPTDGNGSASRPAARRADDPAR